MRKGLYRRLKGIVRLNGHSPMLDVEDLGLIKLQTEEDLSASANAEVTVEGELRDQTLIVEWIGPPSRDPSRT